LDRHRTSNRDLYTILNCVIGIRDDSIIVDFLGPFVHYYAGENGTHVGTEDDGYVVECSWTDCYAAIFGEEDGDWVAL